MVAQCPPSAQGSVFLTGMGSEAALDGSALFAEPVNSLEGAVSLQKGPYSSHNTHTLKHRLPIMYTPPQYLSTNTTTVHSYPLRHPHYMYKSRASKNLKNPAIL